MKYQPGLFDVFISPVTGKITINGVQDLEDGYVWLGGQDNLSYASPIIQDIKLEIIKIQTNLGQTKFILQSAHDELYNAQALDELQDGILKHIKGVVEIAIPGTDFLSPDLSQGKLWVGNADNKAAEQQTISIDNLPPLQAATIDIGPVSYGIWQMWQGTVPGRPEASYNISTTLAQIDFAFKSTNWIIGKSGIVPGALSYPNAQFIDTLPSERILTHVSDGVIGVASLTHNYFWVGDENNIPVETNKLPSGSLPDLSYKHLWIGDETNRPQENLLILMDNLPNLTFKAIWRGNAAGRPEESESLTILEAQVTYIQDVVIPGIEAEITAIQGQIAVLEGEVVALEAAVAVLQVQVLALSASVASLGSRVSTLESDVSTLQSQMSTVQAQIVTIQGQIVAINTRIDNLRLNTIPADGDVSFYNYKLINLADPTLPTDGVNLRTLGSAIDNISLDGFVLGSSDNTGLIHTTRGPLCLLTNIPAGGDVSLDTYRITDLGDYEADRDAISVEGVWDLFHNPEFYSERINPELNIIGGTQNFTFGGYFPRSVYQVDNSFIPTSIFQSKNISEMRNYNLSGYRFVQETNTTNKTGNFYIEKFEDAQEEGEKILSFDAVSDNIVIEKILNANNERIINVQEEPLADQDSISFLYLWRVLNDEVF